MSSTVSVTLSTPSETGPPPVAFSTMSSTASVVCWVASCTAPVVFSTVSSTVSLDRRDGSAAAVSRDVDASASRSPSAAGFDGFDDGGSSLLRQVAGFEPDVEGCT